MRAVVCRGYGPPEVLYLEEVSTPVPGDNEVLVKVFATTVTAGDVRIRGFDVPFVFWIPFRLTLGIRRPRIPVLGMELAGEIVSVGSKVKGFKPGDRVFGSTPWMKFGANAQYACLVEGEVMAKMPAGMTFEEVASVPFMGIGTLYFLKQANIEPGQRVLIHGASGAVGTFAVQLAKHFGAEVTGVCSAPNVDLVRSLGADFVLDYTQEEIPPGGEVYDVIFDTVGKSSFSRCLDALKREGIYLLANPGLSHMIRGWITSATTSRKVIGGTAQASQEDLLLLRDLMEKGELKAVIDRSYPMDQIVEAHRYVDQGHKIGNVVISVIHS
jgi:NADPH:quinone reductase-like Zn-dependent oxidoreductase